MAKMTPMKAIRQNCIDCCGGNRKEVKLCPVKTCALYDYRMGHRPQLEEPAPAAAEAADGATEDE